MWSNLVSNPRRGRQLLGLFVLVLGVGALAAPSLGKIGQRGVTILDLESMRTSTKAAELIARLGSGGVDDARMATYLDFPLLVLYGVALSAACIVVAARAADRGSARLAAAGRSIAWLALIAAACDAVEDVAILVVLGGNVDQPWPAIASVFAAVKFGLLAVVIVYLVAGLALTLRRRVPREAA
jgi:hypothetical protein